jgi:crotonobetainyl-CoA:carnitine CoA-transferase CaiB-like acyl-CoA transferase
MYGRVRLPNSPMRYDGVEPIELKPSGQLGCDDHAVYGDWLGLSDSEIQKLIEDEVI